VGTEKAAGNGRCREKEKEPPGFELFVRQPGNEMPGSLMQIRGIDGMTLQDIQAELRRGGRFVHFEWCVSVLVMTFRRPTDVYFLRSGQNGFGSSWPFTLASLLFGWWGIPWGFIQTPGVLWTNLCGGRNVSGEVLAFLAALETMPGDRARGLNHE
jgi:hypothetical protein